MFPDNETSEKWLEQKRWGDKGPVCPRCKCGGKVTEAKNRKPMPYWCGTCRNRFSVKTGTVMQSSKISYQNWVIAMYMYVCNLKGVSSMKLHRDLGITQKSAWFLVHRLREAMISVNVEFEGPVEVDETGIGGKRKNMSNKKRKDLKDTGRGMTGKTIVVGMKDRKTNKIKAQVVPNTKAETLHEFIEKSTGKDTQVYTDESRSYLGLDRRHEAVNHSIQDIIERKVPSEVLLFEVTKFSFYYVIYISFSTCSLLRWIRRSS